METAAARKEDVLSRELEVYKQQGANLLMPSTHIAGLSEFHHPVIETVQADINPESGDVYPHDNAKDGPKKKFRPTKQLLMKLSVCAGVIWSVDQSRRIDNGANRDYCAYRAVGGIRKADGQPVFFSADHDMDFEVIEEELQDLYLRKIEAGKRPKGNGEKGWAAEMSAERCEKWVDDCVQRDMIQKRKFKLRLCEAGAMNRVLRSLLGLKQAYTREELEKPFVMARIVFRPDFNDKDVRAQLIAASIQSMTGIYGPKALAHDVKQAEPIDVTPIPEEDPEGDDPGGNGAGEQMAGSGPGVECDEHVEIVIRYQKTTEAQQIQIIKQLVDMKAYDLPKWLASARKIDLGGVNAARRLELFKYLLTLPDAQPPSDDRPEDRAPF
jgi:hypothetical protein